MVWGGENQGAGIAIGYIDANFSPDLVIFHIDNPSGLNGGYYRIGWNIDNYGNASYWTNPILIPGWFGGENAGGDIAIIDLNNNGKPELVIFHIDNPTSYNNGYYRIGWDLDVYGNVIGWSEVKYVPEWFSGDNQGAGICSYDINNNGRPEFIIFQIDNPSGLNGGYFKIGWDVSQSGNASNWSEWRNVPGWFGGENQGAGITTCDIDKNGKPELVVFHIDNPRGNNGGYYRIGWNMTNAGWPAYWTTPQSIPISFGWENQGAGIASIDVNLNGMPEFITLFIDNPTGLNHAYYNIGWDASIYGLPKISDTVSMSKQPVKINYNISQNYPNPFNPTTSLIYSIPEKSFVKIAVYDVLGREISILEEGIKDIGNYTAKFNGSMHASGIYFCRFTTVGEQSGESYIKVVKMLLAK